MKNDGKTAEVAFEKHWLNRGHVERLRDKKDLMGLNKGLKMADFAKPADFLVSSPNDELHYAEVKSTSNPDSFAFAKIQPAQSAAALKEVARGRGSYIFYIFSVANGCWYAMNADQYILILGEGRRSVKFSELTTWKI